MRIRKCFALPVMVLLTILATQSTLNEARYINLQDENKENVNVGNVTAHETTVGQLKEIISTRLRVEIDSLRLTDFNNNLFLDDEKLLSDYLGMNSISATYNTVKIRDDLKKKGEIVVYKDERLIEILVTKDKTLGWLKREALGENENDQKSYRVFFEGRQLLDNSKTLGEYKLFKGARLVMVRDEHTFLVYLSAPDASIVELRLPMNTSVREFKRIVENQGISINTRLLTYNKIVLDDEKRLSSYSKYSYLGMTIYIVERMGDGGGMVEMFYHKFDFVLHFPVFVIPNNTIGELKEYTFSVERSIPVERMKLKFSGQLLDDDSKKIRDYDIYPGAWVEVRKQ